MRVTSRIVWDMATWEVLEHEFQDIECPKLDMAKGSDVANEQRQEMLNESKQAFAAQMSTLNDLKSSFGKYLTDNIGFDPQTMSAMTSDALNQNALAYNQAGSTIRDQITAMGGNGDLPIGGNTIGRLASLSGMAASQKASTLNNLNIMNAQQALANKFNAGSILSGNAATLGGTFGAATSGASNALNAYITAKNSGFGSSFANALGGTLGKGLGMVATGGLGGFLSDMGLSGANITGKG